MKSESFSLDFEGTPPTGDENPYEHAQAGQPSKAVHIFH